MERGGCHVLWYSWLDFILDRGTEDPIPLEWEDTQALCLQTLKGLVPPTIGFRRFVASAFVPKPPCVPTRGRGFGWHCCEPRPSLAGSRDGCLGSWEGGGWVSPFGAESIFRSGLRVDPCKAGPSTLNPSSPRDGEMP
ncbi:hypothetical protein HJG60_012075 [Phyllostomus discolor]|uniref:Uncharacterized protein n=1 Tax=Phyllostomus discolor TaxID=89673 RepID=A0A833ZES0_9CHIR|nr:hypothetical protein HJG60_012075 [Phyllostomus discolor]